VCSVDSVLIVRLQAARGACLCSFLVHWEDRKACVSVCDVMLFLRGAVMRALSACVIHSSVSCVGGLAREDRALQTGAATGSWGFG
jgi:hypothetical protein